MNTFDIIIGGAGISGLTLAYYLNASSLNKKKIAIIDLEPFNKKDNYISFWTKDSYFFDSLVNKSWNEIQIFFHDYEKQYSLQTYSYKLISALSYKQYIIKQISNNPNISFIKDTLLRYSMDTNVLTLVTKNNTYKTKLLFDSTYNIQQYQTYDHLLYMHAFTQEIKTNKKRFNPSSMTFLDFRSGTDSSFCYSLPITNNRAVFQLTTTCKNPLLNKKRYEKELKLYLSQIQKLHSYEIVNEQYGIIPLTDKVFQRKVNPFVMNIGLNGGQIKPSTGFGFTKIIEDSKTIVDSLEKNDEPFFIRHTPSYYSVCDSVFLEIISSQPKRMKHIFKDMFQYVKNPEDIFKFLNEQSSLFEIIKLFKNVNYYPFIKALLSKNIYHKFVH